MKHRAYAKKIDANQPEIIMALKKIGCEVEAITGKKGMPDLLVSRGTSIYLLEVKNRKGKNIVNEDQKEFHKRFPITVVRSIEEAINAVTK